MLPFSANIPSYSNTIFSKSIKNLHPLQAKHISMCSACNHFLKIYVFTVILLQYVINNLYHLQAEHAWVCSACNHCLQIYFFTVILFSVYYRESLYVLNRPCINVLCMYPFSINMPFYSTTIFSKIIRNRRLQPVHASMCPAGNHFLQKYLFTAILFPVTISITFIAYKQNMQRCAPHVPIFYKDTCLL